MESIIRDEVIEHLMTNSLVNDAQHGFVPGRSCITQLLTTLEDWTSVLDAGEDVDVIYLDIKKAFDSVPHLRLSSNLEAYNITGQIKDWISEFLHDRRQRVVINSAKSNWSKVKSGVPQGSVLAPILFALYINDLPENLKSKAKIYADDTKNLLYCHYTCSTKQHTSRHEDTYEMVLRMAAGIQLRKKQSNAHGNKKR